MKNSKKRGMKFIGVKIYYMFAFVLCLMMIDKFFTISKEVFCWSSLGLVFVCYMMFWNTSGGEDA